MSSRKKRKLDSEGGDAGACIGDVVADIDLEVRLRQRLAEALESRITWALILQDALRKGSNGSTTAFENAAFDTLSAIEAPLDILFTREDFSICKTTSSSARKDSRPPPRQKLTVRNPGANFLYINSGDLHPPYGENHIQTYLLRCPQCLRTAFTSLQGLLNHARISHRLEWGTHDECVRACAVRDPELDITLGIEVGLGPNGLRPGLRSLFKMAVGAHHPTSEPDTHLKNAEPLALPPTASLHLTRTLGLHEDTPALAPFLGKQRIRRGIRVWDEEEDADVDGFEGTEFRERVRENGKGGLLPPYSPEHGWRMQYAHRNEFSPLHATSEPAGNMEDVGVVLDSSSEESRERRTTQNSAHTEKTSISTTPGSRFHFIARIVVVDRSLWIPPERRQACAIAHPYKWMISIDSPSYSHHITTILQTVVVSSLSDSTGNLQSLTTSKPPFVVVGTADEPFLAKIELCFSGTSNILGETTSQTVVLEHWVELDPLKSSTPALGDEQVVDIELDKGTKLLPIQNGYTPIGAKSLWHEPNEGVRKRREVDATSSQEYEKILEDLLDKFPLTLKNVKGSRAPPQVPYKLVVTIAQFKNLIPGRRKAIEWGRAHAIRNAYMQAIQEQPSEGLIPLTTADVFTWLSRKSRPTTPRIGSSLPRKDNSRRVECVGAQTWCPVCGRKESAEGRTATPSMKTEADPSPMMVPSGLPRIDSAGGVIAQSKPNPCCFCPCLLAQPVAKMPIVDVFIRLGNSDSDSTILQCYRTGGNSDGIKKFRDVDLVKAAHPQITTAVRNILHRLKLPSFLPSSNEMPSSEFPLERIGGSKASIEVHLAPYAVLAIATRSFLRILIEGGLQACKKDDASFAGSVRSKEKLKASEDERNVSCLLTPAHILSGVIRRRRGSDIKKCGVNRMIYELMTRLGAPMEPKDQEIAEKEETTPAIKLEES